MRTAELRLKLKRYYRDLENAQKLFASGKDVLLPEFPEECLGMICGAKTKSGHLCQETTLCKNGRCAIHGGLSTGPKTLEGKRRSALNTGKTYEELIRTKAS